MMIGGTDENKLEDLFDKEYIKLENDVYTIYDSSDKAMAIIDGIEKVINLYPNNSIFIKVEWVRLTLFNLFPRTHYYKNEFETTMEIIRACESNGYARDNKRLRRLLKLN